MSSIADDCQLQPNPQGVDPYLIQAIRAWMEASPDGYLPSVAAMAKALERGFHPISRALAHLKSQGELTFSRGRRIRLTKALEASMPALTAVVPRPVSSGELFRLRIRQKIFSGAWRTGEALPNTQYLAYENGLARSTVTHALAALAAEGLLARYGRAWRVIGSVPFDLQNAGSQRVLLIVQAAPHAWLRLRNERTQSFVQAFQQSADRLGVRLMACDRDDWELRRRQWVECRGRDAVLELCRSLKGRYLGTLITGEAREVEAGRDVWEALLRLDRPVLWMDPTGKDDDQALLEKRRRLPRCRFSNRRLADTAIRLLHDAGCRQAIWAATTKDAEWQRERKELLQTIGASLNPPLRVRDYTDLRASWPFSDADAFARRLQAAERSNGPVARKALRYMLHHFKAAYHKTMPMAQWTAKGHRLLADWMLAWPLAAEPEPLQDLGNLIFALLEEGMDAIIAPRDRKAQLLWYRLNALDMRIPEDFRLLSFDNALDFTESPVTTVGIGADTLGFDAFHALVGDMPVARDARGDVVARPMVVHRGTI